MHFWSSYPFIRLSIALITGICLVECTPVFWQSPPITLACLSILPIALVLLSQKVGFYRLRHLNGLVSLMLIIFIGGYLVKLHYHSQSDTHYRFIDYPIRGYSGIVKSDASDRKNHLRFDLELIAVHGDSAQLTNGKIHLYIRKDSLAKSTISKGDKIAVRGSFHPIPKPGNPKTFDYKQHLEKQKIYANAFTRENDFEIIDTVPQNWLASLAHLVKSRAIEIINTSIPEPRESSVLLALILGMKDLLESDLKESYAKAGAMHVLAVSGLHVGILFLILKMLLGKLIYAGRLGRWTFVFACITVIWFYTLLTGLSPSVLRAATMFSLVVIGEALAKDSNIFNTLGVAVFTLLCFDPYLIYTVSFQLSFTAVFGIVYLQPKIYGLFQSRFWILDRIWAITCVSVAAQVATFPISLFCFHQFPSYSLLSNVIVVPGAFITFILGLLMIVLFLFSPIIGQLIGRLLYHVLWFINESIEWIESLPASTMESYLSQIDVVAIYTVAITMIWALHFRSYKVIVLSSSIFLLFLLHKTYVFYNQSNEHKLILYDINNQLAIDHIDGYTASLYVQYLSKSKIQKVSDEIDPYRRSIHVEPASQKLYDLKKVFSSSDVMRLGILANQKILILDSTTFHLDFHDTMESDILIINNNAVKSVDWLLTHFKFTRLIISNLNSRHYSNLIKKKAKERGVKAHSLAEDGALMIEIKE